MSVKNPELSPEARNISNMSDASSSSFVSKRGNQRLPATLTYIRCRSLTHCFSNELRSSRDREREGEEFDYTHAHFGLVGRFSAGNSFIRICGPFWWLSAFVVFLPFFFSNCKSVSLRFSASVSPSLSAVLLENVECRIVWACFQVSVRHLVCHKKKCLSSRKTGDRCCVAEMSQTWLLYSVT